MMNSYTGEDLGTAWVEKRGQEGGKLRTAGGCEEKIYYRVMNFACTFKYEITYSRKITHGNYNSSLSSFSCCDKYIYIYMLYIKYFAR